MKSEKSNKIFDKQYYINLYNERGIRCKKEWAKDVEAGEADWDDFDSLSDCFPPLTAGEVAGYYLWVYEDNALNQWNENLKYATEKNDTDDEVIRILSALCC